ncbi:hypothetical protein FRB99_004328 [Tulasnella sp. 403]|nr:hypothetical protein FRB99_004328 [Tulasnella sp. 403]
MLLAATFLVMALMFVGRIVAPPPPTGNQDDGSNSSDPSQDLEKDLAANWPPPKFETECPPLKQLSFPRDLAAKANSLTSAVPKLGEWYGVGKRTGEKPTYYIIMKYHDVVGIWRTLGWKAYVSQNGGFYRDSDKSEEGCLAFFNKFFQDVGLRAWAYARQMAETSGTPMLHGDLHFQNVLLPEDYPLSMETMVFIDWEDSFASDHPEVMDDNGAPPSSIKLPEAFPSGIATDIVPLGSGKSGCVYGVRWQGKFVAAAKMVEQWSLDPEARMLEKLSEFYGATNTDPDTSVLLMEFHEGVKLWKTSGWQVYVSETWGYYRDDDKDEQACLKFFMDFFSDVAARARDYAERTAEKDGQYIENGDLWIGNVLLPKDYPEVKDTISIVDWETWNPTSSAEAAGKHAYDTLARGIEYQDICKGKLSVFEEVRENGAYRLVGSH